MIDMAIFGTFIDNFMCWFAGAMCGVVFVFCRLPLTAPGELSGIVGILAIFGGFNFMQYLTNIGVI